MTRSRSNGEGTLRQRDNGKWEARYYGVDRRQYSKTFPKKALAQRWLTEQINAVNEGRWRDPSRAKEPMATFIDSWLAAKAIKCKPRTLHGYRLIADAHLRPTFGQTPVSAMTPATVDRFVGALVSDGAKAGTVRNVFNCLKAVLDEAVRARAIPANPAKGTELPRPTRREMLFLTPEQVQAVADAMPDEYRLAVLFAAYTGLRWGEMTGLKVGRVDTMRRTVDVVEALTWIDGEALLAPPKSDASQRSVTMPRFLNDLMVEHLAGRAGDRDAFVFCGPNGGPMRHHTVYRVHFRRAVREVLPEHLHGLRWHDLRHTCVAMLIAAGAHPKAVANRMGHSTINITMDRYGHLYPDEDERLADGLDAAYARTLADAGPHVAGVTAM